MKKKLIYVMFFCLGYNSIAQECTKIDFPSEGATDVPVDVLINWPAVSGINGYLISLGTTPGGTDIIDSEPTGITNSYQAPLGLPENTLIFATVSIIPFDSPPVECESSDFTTTDVTTAPGCTFLVAPDNNAANVTVVTDIVWQYAPTATSYTLSIGTSEGGTDILNELNVGNVLSYDPPDNLPQDLWIFVTIVPENENGAPSSCLTESFFTGPIDDPCEETDPVSGETISLKPKIEFPSSFVQCAGSGSKPVSVEGDADGFRWYRVMNGEVTLLSEGRNFQISEIGNFVLESYNEIIRSGVVIECLSFNGFSVIPSEVATIESIEIERLTFGKRVTVNVLGSGNYEFALDDENGPYQDENVFKDIPEGPHIVYVRDKNGCGVVSQLIDRGLTADDFPSFFTPNGDGINDYWQFVKPVEFNDILEVLVGKIAIFDKFGGLLVEIDPESKGWDGNFNGKPLPSSDYWFKALSPEQKEIQGHFALKR